jgi:hypothetical protein
MGAMTKHRSHSAAFKRQVAEGFVAGETLHALERDRALYLTTTSMIASSSRNHALNGHRFK